MRRSIHILLIDDDLDFLVRLGKCLQFEDIKSESYADPRAGLEAFKAGGFEIVSTDLSMPEMSGLELIQALREHNPAVRILVVTGNYDEEACSRALSCGASAVLTKPLDLRLFIQAITKNSNSLMADSMDSQPGRNPLQK